MLYSYRCQSRGSTWWLKWQLRENTVGEQKPFTRGKKRSKFRISTIVSKMLSDISVNCPFSGWLKNFMNQFCRYIIALSVIKIIWWVVVVRMQFGFGGSVESWVMRHLIVSWSAVLYNFFTFEWKHCIPLSSKIRTSQKNF